MMRRLFFSVISLVFAAPAPAQDLYDLQHSLDFTDYLIKTRQYVFAVQELERVHYLDPGNDSISFRLMEAYRKSGKQQQGITRAEELYPALNFPPPVAMEYAKQLIESRQFDKAGHFLSGKTSLTDHDSYLLKLNCELLNNRWKEAAALFVSGDTAAFPLSKEYLPVIQQGMHLRYKSPGIALALSTLLPGAGKFYTKDWQDGLISMVTILAAAWQAKTGFSKKGIQSTYGWIYSCMGVGFYSGNLYGSYKAAKKYNRRLDEKLHKQVEDIWHHNF